MKCTFIGDTDPGLVRSNNQDYYYIDGSQNRYCIVADGMGGHAGGQEASQIAVDAIHAFLDKNWATSEPTESLLKEALLKANDAILQDQAQHPERSDMGTTLVMFAYRESQFWVAHVGDSRCYLLRENILEQVTDDHTWVARAMRSGDLTPEQAKNHPWRHVLSKCLGRKDINAEQIEVNKLDIQEGDRLLLCSDGLTEEVPDNDINHLLSQSDTNKVIAQLIETAKHNGGKDNITVVIAEIAA
jgi:PPM family protein phosphatase